MPKFYSSLGTVNAILVVDDDRRKFEFYWRIFNDDPHEFDPLPPEENSVRDSPLLLHYLEDFTKFEQMFGQMVELGDRYPLCIVDVHQDENSHRGIETVRLVRELDPDISIVVATHLPEGFVDLEDVREVAGDNACLFRLPMADESKRAEFRTTVHLLVDRWNAKRRLLRSMRESSSEPVPLSGMLNGICSEWHGKNVSVEPYINSGLSVHSHREPLAQGLHCLLRYAVETVPPDGRIRVIGETTSSGAMVTVVIYEPREVAPRSLDELTRAGKQALGFFLFETFLRSTGGSLKVKSGGSSKEMTLTADIRHV